jgi:hypothetical protein
MKNRFLTTPEILNSLKEKLENGNRKSIYLNSSVSNQRDRVDLKNLQNLMNNQDTFLEWLLGENNNVNFTIDLNSSDPVLNNNENQLDVIGNLNEPVEDALFNNAEDEQNPKRRALLLAKFDNIIQGSKENMEENGISGQAFGYPILDFQIMTNNTAHL